MATRHLFGNARILWTPPGGSQETFLLGAKLIELEPMDRRARWDWWSADMTEREVVVVGSGVRDLVATIRYDDDPDGLKRMLRLALENDLTLTYHETAGGTGFPVRLVAVVGGSGADAVHIIPDRDRWRLGEYEARVHLRRTDGGTLDGLL